MTRAASNTSAASALSWPNPQDYAGLLKTPRVAFRSKDLWEIQILTNHQGLPRPWAGAFANVYQGTLPGGTKRAIRVFICAMPERRQRLEAVAAYLRAHPLKCLVDFTYEDRGIRSGRDGKFYPLVTMEWVAGDTLYDWVRARCLQENRSSLDRACQLWVETIAELAGAGIAHGDLQHGNVMVSANGQPKIRLVDYDCMCVPGLAGLKNLEIGVEPYQHPQRDENTRLSPDLDNFSAIFIYAALRALAVNPRLWHNYVEKPPPYDKLLFRREDLEAPQRSPLMHDLKGSGSQEVWRLAQDLAELAHTPIDQVPPLSAALFSWDTVRSLLSRKQFDEAVELVTRNRKQPGQAPPPLPTQLRDAQQRVQQRRALAEAVSTGDEAAMQRLYVPKLLDDYPKAGPPVAVAKLAPRVIPVLAQLQEAGKKQQGRGLVKIWDANQSLLSNRTSAQAIKPLVEKWRQRNQACDLLLKLLKQPGANPNAVEAAWNTLEKLGGHPEAEPYRAQLQTLLQRQRAWAELVAVGQTPSQDTDERLVRTWEKHQAVFANWDAARPHRQRVEQARQRLALLRTLEQEAAKPPALEIEQALSRIAHQVEQTCAGYSYGLRGRVVKARERADALGRLLTCVDASDSDVEIAKAFQKVDHLGCREMVPAGKRPRVSQAVKRYKVLRELKKIPRKGPPKDAPQHDEQLLRVWKEALLRGCSDADPWRPLHQRAVERRQVLDQLKAVINSGDQQTIVDLAGRDCLKDYPLPPAWVGIVERARADVGAVQRLMEMLSQDRRADFWDVFDARLLRRNAAAAARYEARLREWLPAEILPARRLGLAQPVACKALTREPGSNTAYRARWQWPDPRFSEHCLLVVTRSRPAPEDDPRKIAVQLRQPVNRTRYEEGSGSVPFNVPREWARCYVVVWAAVDVGLKGKDKKHEAEVFFSEPLILGRVGV